MFVKRPKRGEDDDDLLRFQEEFLRGGGDAPSAKVVRVNQPKPPTVRSPKLAESVPPEKSNEKKQPPVASDMEVPEDPIKGKLFWHLTNFCPLRKQPVRLIISIQSVSLIASNQICRTAQMSALGFSW